jgi:predicted AAA+ superfamily ATPase
VAALHVAAGWRALRNCLDSWELDRKRGTESLIAVLDGEKSNPADAVFPEGNVRACTLWEELAFRLGHKCAFQAFAGSNRWSEAPSVANIRELLQDGATLILVDALNTALHRAEQACEGSKGQLLAFVSNLFEAVASTRNCALVYTLPFGMDDPDRNPYRRENRELAVAIDRAEACLSDQPLHVTPIENSEVLDVVRRRLFARIEDATGLAIADDHPLHRTYPLHPATVDVLRRKISSANTSQSIRGTLRVLKRTIRSLWSQRPEGTIIIEPGHLDFSGEIERLAYYYWEQAGRPDGSAETHWLRAEQAFSSC